MKERPLSSNGSCLTYGALKKDSFRNVRASPASGTCWTAPPTLLPRRAIRVLGKMYWLQELELLTALLNPIRSDAASIMQEPTRYPWDTLLAGDQTLCG